MAEAKTDKVGKNHRGDGGWWGRPGAGRGALPSVAAALQEYCAPSSQTGRLHQLMGNTETSRSRLPARFRRLQALFLTGVAVFFLATAALKLITVLTESPFLGRTDALVHFLTVRQLLFLAALIELTFAWFVLRHCHTVMSLLLGLWLVALFAVYRLGLLAVGFEGQCPCLGRLLDSWPLAAAWADRLLVLALCFIGSGSIGFLIYRTTHSWGGHHSAPSNASLRTATSHCGLGYPNSADA